MEVRLRGNLPGQSVGHQTRNVVVLILFIDIYSQRSKVIVTAAIRVKISNSDRFFLPKKHLLINAVAVGFSDTYFCQSARREGVAVTADYCVKLCF